MDNVGMDRFNYWINFYMSHGYKLLWNNKGYYCWAGVGYYCHVWLDSDGCGHQMEWVR